MRLIFDQNISYRIIKLVHEFFPASLHITKAGLNNATDFEIWAYAKREEYSIVTFDRDFLNLAILNGHPPKIILLKTGNRRTAEIAKLFIDNKDLVIEFLQSESYQDIACLEISE